jgi:hypothetical protein
MTLALGEGAHPIFYLPQKKLLGLYSKHCKGHLTDKDSYLLFLALLNSTDAVKFTVPATYTTKTNKLVANNIAQLVRVIWETDAITIPSFKQPMFYIRDTTADLNNVDSWIAAWEDNIVAFKNDYQDNLAWEALKKAEHKLTYVIRAGTKDAKYAAAVATWANKAAEFPKEVAKNWEGVIRRCFNPGAMFSTPKATLKEIKDYCECNIEVGSIHFHALMEVLNAGIKNHCDFLGLWDADVHNTGASLEVHEKEQELRAELISRAPEKEPVVSDYPTKLAYLRAKVAWSMLQKDTKDLINAAEESVQ